MKNKYIWILIFGIFAGIFLYRESYNSYFFQDDWFSFRISTFHNIKEFLSVFIPRTDVIYYRPFGMQIPFFLIKNLFGLNNIAFRLLNLITHLANTVLVFQLAKLILKKKSVSAVIAFMYCTSSVYYIPFYWSATYAFILGPFFLLNTIIRFIKFTQKKDTNLLIVSLVFYFFGLLTYEISVILPLILFLYLCYIRKLKNTFFSLFPYILLAVIFVIFRFVFFKPPTTGLYTLDVDRFLINNLKGYILWSFNWPEEMKAQFISFFRINPEFIKNFFGYYLIFIITLVINVVLLLIFPAVFLILKKKGALLIKFLCFGILWYIIGLTPVLFFSQHSYAYYLPLSLVGLLLSTLLIFYEALDYLKNRYKTIYYAMQILLILNWLIGSYFTIDFNSKIHWAPKRAILARKLIEENRSKIQGNNVYIYDTSENRLALNDQDAFKVILGDYISTIYGNNE